MFADKSGFNYPDCFFLYYWGFTPCKAEQPLQSMELQEKETQKDKGILEICLERTYI